MHTEPQITQTPRLGHYEIDVSQSRVTFRTRHMFGLGPVRGTFAIRSGSADIAEPLADSAIHAEIDTASFSTGNEQRDTSVLSARFLDAARFPVISFRDGHVCADGRTIRGTLTVREVSRPVSLSIGQVTVAGQSFTASATVRVDRTEFGLTAMPGLAGRYLDLTVEVRCTLGGRLMPNAVEVSGLRKSYGRVHAVRDVGFTVGYGEIVALLGPNGAGKTTTLEILEGFRARDGGTAEVLGYDPGERSSARELRERTGLVLQDVAVEPYLTVRETIARAAGYYRAPRGVAEVIGLAGLTGLERRKVRSLSGGQKRRLDLALGLIGNPALLYLDEPTTGFDPAARRDAWQLVRGLRTAGMTILLTTHDMDEAQALADRVVLLSGGVVVAAGEPAALGGRDAERARISFRLPAGYTAADLPVSSHSANGTVVVETDAPTQALHRLTDWAIGHGHVLAGLTVERPSLEDVYLELTHEGAPARAPERIMR